MLLQHALVILKLQKRKYRIIEFSAYETYFSFLPSLLNL